MTTENDETDDGRSSIKLSRRSYMTLSTFAIVGSTAAAATEAATARRPEHARGRSFDDDDTDDDSYGYVENGYVKNGYGENGYGENGYVKNGYVENGYGENGYGRASWAPVTETTSTDDSEDTNSSETLIVEDAEGDLSAYTGNTRYYGTTSDAISGSRSLIAIDAEHGGYRTIASTAGLSNYPEAGDTFRFDVAVDTRNTYGAVLWGVQSESSPWPCYRLRLDTGATPGVEFEKITTDLESHNNSEDNKLAPWLHDNEDVRPDVGTVYTVTVEWRTDGLMPFTIEEKATGAVLVEETDPNPDAEYTSGGVGFMSSRSWDGQDQAEARFDNYELL